MTDFTKLIAWYISNNVEDIDIDDIGDFTEDDIQTAIFDFGVDNTNQPSARGKLRPVRDNMSNVADDIFDKIQNSTKFISKIIRKRDLDFYGKLINRKVQPILAKTLGTEYAEERIDKAESVAEFERSTEWLRLYNPQRLGFIKGIKTYKEKIKSFRLVFG